MWIRYTLINLDLLTSQDLYFVPTLWLLIHNGPNQLPKLSTNEATSMRKFTFLRFCCRRFFFPWKIHENKASRTNLEFFWSISLILWGLLIMILWKVLKYTVNNYRQVTGMTTGENFAFFIYRHFVEIL